MIDSQELKELMNEQSPVPYPCQNTPIRKFDPTRPSWLRRFFWLISELFPKRYGSKNQKVRGW